jgi:hypothetical protein
MTNQHTYDNVISNLILTKMLIGALETMLDVQTYQKAGISITLDQAAAYIKAEHTKEYCIDRLLELNINITSLVKG